MAQMGEEKVARIKDRVQAGDIDGSESQNDRLYNMMRAAQAKEAEERAAGAAAE